MLGLLIFSSLVEKPPCLAHFAYGVQGSARRKKKVIHRTNTTDDKKLQVSLKKLGLTTIPGIEEVEWHVITTINISCLSMLAYISINIPLACIQIIICHKFSLPPVYNI